LHPVIRSEDRAKFQQKRRRSGYSRLREGQMSASRAQPQPTRNRGRLVAKECGRRTVYSTKIVLVQELATRSMSFRSGNTTRPSFQLKVAFAAPVRTLRRRAYSRCED
jgi:hypothetical protein